MATIAGGLVGSGTILGFGSSTANVTLLGNTINLTGAAGIPLDFAFNVPRNGTITDISAFYGNVVGLSLIGSTATIQAQVYSAPAGSNTFTAVPGTAVTLAPTLSGVLNIGQTSYATVNGLSVPVTAGSRLLLFFSATVTGLSLVNTFVGYMSAGVAIA
jgi:BclB C-terminal domain-containing protein